MGDRACNRAGLARRRVVDRCGEYAALSAARKCRVADKHTILTGKSTTEFIRFIRLNKARELLVGTDLHISEIGYDTGFQNPNYFTKRFGEVFGCSPSEYRERGKNDGVYGK